VSFEATAHLQQCPDREHRQLAELAGVAQSEIARIESGKRAASIPTRQKILVGAGLELGFRFAPLDYHDLVSGARHARRSKAEEPVVEERLRCNVEKFAANAPKP
jgi:transcriptional regulator with XRE-family HTH domain